MLGMALTPSLDNEALALLCSSGVSVMLTSPLCFGTKSELGFLPCPGHSVALYRLMMGSGRVNRWCLLGCARWPIAWLGSKLHSFKQQAEPATVHLMSSPWLHRSLRY